MSSVTRLRLVWLAAALSALPRYSLGAPANTTIDDNDQSISYSGGWSNGQCSSCSVQLDRSQTYGGTWHDALFMSPGASGDTPQRATITFEGNIIYVFCALSSHTDSHYSFSLDGNPAGTFNHTATADSHTAANYEYNVNVFASDALSIGEHTLVLQNSGLGGPTSQGLLDYVVYTTGLEDDDDGDSSPSSPTATSGSSSPSDDNTYPGSPPTTVTATTSVLAQDESSTSLAAIVAPAVIVPVLAIMAGILFYLWRRRNHRRIDPATAVDVFIPPPHITAHPETRQREPIQTSFWSRKGSVDTPLSALSGDAPSSTVQTTIVGDEPSGTWISSRQSVLTDVPPAYSRH